MDVKLINIHKRFGKVHANNAINLEIPGGTIQGILGENGAGKSTLMKILSGFIGLDEGQILLDGKLAKINSPVDAIRQGIGMLHQDPLDFPPMRVLENFVLGHEEELFTNWAVARKAFTKLQAQFDMHLAVDAFVDTLTVGERQQLEILRLLWLGARVLILDEPTTGISAAQKEKLFQTLQTLAEQGMTVIFVSHKLEDVERLCSRVAVLRRGELVGQAGVPFDIDHLVELMFGKVVNLDERFCACQDENSVRLANLSIEDVRLQIRGVNFVARRGEVIGLAGMEGSGQRQFLQTLGGLRRPVGGHLTICGKDLAGKDYASFMRMAVGYMPAARLEEGLVPGLTFIDHVVLADEEKSFFIDRKKARQQTLQKIQLFNVRGTPESRVESLSGGNQQRALLSLLRVPLNLLLMEHPTRGLDIESSIAIWAKLKERCKQGTTIFFISADLEEILHYSDRILVFFNGKVSEPLDAATTTVEELGQRIGGKGME